MAIANNRTQCFTCNKNKITYPCEGCSQRFCLMDLTEHRQILNNELHHIINEYNQFKQRFTEQKPNPHDLSLIDQIKQWETDSIDKIKQRAKDCRETVIRSSQTVLNDIEKKFNDLNEQIKQIHKENEYNELNLEYLRNQLKEMTQKLNNPSKMPVQQNLRPLINDISIILSKNVIVDQQNHSIIVADQGNRRVIQWLNQNQQILIDNIDCFGLTIDKYGFLYVSDYKKNEVRRWKMGESNNEGIKVAGGNGRGNQLNHPSFIFVDEDQSVYVSDFNNHRVMKWKKDLEEGTIVAGGNSEGANLNQLSYPAGVIVDDLSQIYVADFGNHRVIRWCEGKGEGEIVVGGNGKGHQSNQLSYPFDLSFDDEGNLYVVDWENHRIEKFETVL
ncbi:unnamed protein product [Adineta steineri]|uniref:Uncharacterized protein n=1 Tax=Adineta steineri TaxID=433720 RepID=A0A819T5N8_9BILA|nr:unnamed protein product [Adineta steineri]CAF4074230.1 unnamed protein product [Adineta steineri]